MWAGKEGKLDRILNQRLEIFEGIYLRSWDDVCNRSTIQVIHIESLGSGMI